MTKVLDAAQRIRDAVQDSVDRQAAGAAVSAAGERERAAAAARREHEGSEAWARVQARTDDGRDAFAVSADALKRVEYAERAAARLLDDHARDHAVRRDVAEAALGALLERVDAPAVERQLRVEAVRLPALLCDPAGSVDVVRIAGIAAHARQPVETATLLRGLLAEGEYSPLTTADYDAARTKAKTHRAAIKDAVQDARRHHGYAGEALQALERGHAADAATPAARVLDANDKAQGALRDLRAVLYTEEKT